MNRTIDLATSHITNGSKTVRIFSLLAFAVATFSLPIFCLAVQEDATDVAPVKQAPDGMKLVEGFKAEIVHEVAAEQGSWVSLAVDPKGRLITSDQYGKLYRVTLPDTIRGIKETTVEPIELKIGYAHGLLCAFDSLYVVAHAANDMPAGLYRVQDSNDDDQYDTVKLLRKFDGGGEHGPHAVILSPDKKSLFICGGNHTKIPAPETSRVPRVWQEDQVMPRLWDAGGHAVGIEAPGGWICKTDPEGKSFELFSVGFRNQFDIAFNRAGSLFTYDADMEWDIGTPWYRPTRVCKVSSGSEFGWRSGTGKWPEYYQDSLPSVVDIGLGSPTGITFGYETMFPDKYQEALFIADWSYGIIYAVHFPKDPSEPATFERFCSAPALPVADIVANPHDGALYFVTGGRRVKSALYRIQSDKKTVITKLVDYAWTNQDTIEKSHEPGAEIPFEEVWDGLANTDDRFVRFAARTSLELHPVESWREEALKQTGATALTEVVTALARVGTPDDLEDCLNALEKVDWDSITELQQLQLLRAYGLIMIRLDADGDSVKLAVADRFSAAYPAESILLNRELSRILSVCDSELFVDKTMELLLNARSQQESIHYALCMSHVKNGWTKETRRNYFTWFFDAASIRGGNSMRGFLNNIRVEAIRNLDESTKVELGELVTKTPQVENPYKDLKARPFVKKWNVDEVVEFVNGNLESADIENGRRMFSLAQCYSCHRFQGDGGIVGPDLTPAGNRYGMHDLVATLIDPSKEVSDQYQATKFLLNDGKVVAGRVVNLSGDQYMVQTDMINPANLARIKVDEIEEMIPSEVSMMPNGLLDNLTPEEIRDLIAYMKSVATEN